MSGRLLTRLEILRAKRGLTQEELALRAGVSRDVITAIETRRDGRRVRAGTLARLARALEVDLEDLLDDAAA